MGEQLKQLQKHSKNLENRKTSLEKSTLTF